MDSQHQEILQSISEIDIIRSSPRYKALILMSRQANERREYETYCNKIKMYQNKIDKIKEAFPNNYNLTYEQFLAEKNREVVVFSVAPAVFTVSIDSAVPIVSIDSAVSIDSDISGKTENPEIAEKPEILEKIETTETIEPDDLDFA